MKRIIPFLIFAFWTFFSNAQLVDDFSDGDISNNPTWVGTTADFVVNGTFALQSNGNAAAGDTLYLSAPNTLINNTIWEFNVKLDFNPTETGNFVKIYLTSDNADLRGSLNGYYLKLGETGSSDTFELFRQTGTTVTRILNGTIAFTTTTNAKIKVERDSLGLWKVFADPTATGNSYVSQGSVTDSTHKTTSFFGVYCQYSTISRFNQYHFDNINISEIVLDILPPEISTVSVVSNNQIDIKFNEDLEQTSAETPINYSLNNSIGNPTTATLDGTDKSLVHLTFVSTFINGTTYTLTVANIEDLKGNAISSDDAQFTYVVPVYKDIVFSEIFADPTPIVGLPDQEFLEIYNTTAYDIDISGWKLKDNTSTIVFGSKTLAAGGYLILCSSTNTTAFSAFGDVLGISGFPTLTNGGENLQLITNTNDIIDEVTYDDSWHNEDKIDGGWSLELIDPDFPCSISQNWSSSTNPSGGTPGTQNSIKSTITDNIAPFISSYILIGDTAVKLIFSEQLDSSSVNFSAFDVSGTLNILLATLQSDLISVILQLDSTIPTNQIMYIYTSNISDCIGNSKKDTIFFAIGIAPSAGEIVINEIYPDESPSNGLPSAEFLELYNRSDKVLDISGFKITDQKDTTTISSYTMLPKSYLILSSSDLYADYGNLYKSTMPGLNNDGETIQLLDTSNLVLSSVSYNYDLYNDDNKTDGGWSIELINPDNKCGASNKLNWAASVAVVGGTPGTQNSVYGTLNDTLSPKIDRVVAVNEAMALVYFDEAVDSSTLKLANYSIDNSISIRSRGISSEMNIDTLYLLNTLKSKTIYTLTLTDLGDCNGNMTDINTAEFSLPEDPELGDVVINEVLFNPTTTGADFIEMYNVSDKYLDLSRLYVLYFNDTVLNGYQASEDLRVVAPNSYFVLSEDPEKVIFDYPLAVAENIFMAGLPSYANEEGEVMIGIKTSVGYTVLDSLNYNQNMHYALIDNSGDGVSLERLDFTQPTNEKSNWHSAASAVGYATPGYENSQAMNIKDSLSETFTIDPEVFTPDDDGYKDVVFFYYVMDEPGYTANITIFDSYGRMVKELVRNELLATKGYYQWDGVRDDGRKALFGNYIVLFEIFNTSGKQDKFKKIVSVGADFR